MIIRYDSTLVVMNCGCGMDCLNAKVGVQVPRAAAWKEIEHAKASLSALTSSSSFDAVRMDTAKCWLDCLEFNWPRCFAFTALRPIGVTCSEGSRGPVFAS